MSILTDALGYASSTLSAPGDYARGLLAGRPGERVGGRDLLRAYGLAGDEDTWGNFLGGLATDVATDPLTYLGAFGGAGAASSLQAKIPQYATEAAGSLTGWLGKGLNGVGRFKEPLRDVATVKNLEMVPALKTGEYGANTALSRIADGERLAGEMSGRTASQMGRSATRERMNALLDAGIDGDFVANQGGGYVPDAKLMFSTAGSDAADAAKALRHERVHAVIDQAAEGAGDASKLPALMRVPARLRQAGNPDWVQHAGILADELAAQALENRTLAGLLSGAASFLFNPQKNAAYAAQYAAHGLSPYVTGAYRALPGAMVGAGASAGGAAGGLANPLLRALMGDR